MEITSTTNSSKSPTTRLSRLFAALIISGLRILDSKLIQKPCPTLNMKLQPVRTTQCLHLNTETLNINDLV